MHRRPIDQRFVAAVLKDQKVTTIRENPWPVGVPIMLYIWTGKPYRSKQHNICQVIVEAHTPIRIGRAMTGDLVFFHPSSGRVRPRGRMLWSCEGFCSQEDMDDWFRRLVMPGEVITKTLMRFRRVAAMTVMEQPCPACGGSGRELEGWNCEECDGSGTWDF